MDNYPRVIDLAKELIASVEVRDGLLMQQKIDALELAYKEEFRDSLYCYEAIFAFVLMNLASAKYFAHNNMFAQTHARYEDVSKRMGGFMNSKNYNDEQKSEVNDLFGELEKIHKSTPERHQNLVVGRNDTRCCLCRVMPANKTGSHMVPNFLAHPTFSWDGKGKRFHEALNHDFINAQEKNCQFYGREVPDWRFALGEGKKDVTEEDIKKNVNQLEFDNEFCSHCEDRFGVLETAYSQFYNGQQKKIHPRVAYLFWLSVLWRMSMGSMSIFMDMHEELALHKLLDDNMLNTVKGIEESDTDLADWRYAICKADNLRDGDKGILGYRKECSPYVVMYNDLVMVFYHHNPTDEELTIGPISVQREMLNDWHSEEKSLKVDRRWFWDVRDWIDETSYDFYDPAREKALISIRETERSENRVIDDKAKTEAIKVARLTMGPQGKILRIRKLQRIFGVWMRKKEAEEKGIAYDPLNDEDMFLQQRDFDQYYHDLAALSRDPEHHSDVVKFPFYKEARKAIPNESEWKICQEDVGDSAFMDAMEEYMGNLSPKELDHLINGVQEPYINPFAKIGRNDPCPCGSGKKYKKCCGRDI
jgi:hypothetical protein